jgi:pyruvate ferredoxin oxidoreductase delta subunit
MNKIPIWKEEKCRQCLLCAPGCPDMLIPINAGKRTQYNYKHCKGCGICAKLCPYGAIKLTYS